ncbi:MAG TPA: DUF29 domain-containing protein [Rhodopila sp.]|nr:DUF29 domain-containing protein [Rhodopila sp.]
MDQQPNGQRAATTDDLYQRDFYTWANRQAALLRAGDFAAADIANIAEEIESMGRSEKRELINRLAVLLAHLLKWRFQPEHRSRSWQLTVREQRLQVSEILDDNPGLRSALPEAVALAYRKALLIAMRETDLPEETFPAACPWTFDEAMNMAL